jgi:hypothetical protein
MSMDTDNNDMVKTTCEECGKEFVPGIGGDYLALDPPEHPYCDPCTKELDDSIEVATLEVMFDPPSIEEVARLTRAIAEVMGKDEEWVQAMLNARYP